MPKSRPPPVSTEPAPAGSKPGAGSAGLPRQRVELVRTGRIPEELAREWRFDRQYTHRRRASGQSRARQETIPERSGGDERGDGCIVATSQ